jgi:hypothetical protein
MKKSKTNTEKIIDEVFANGLLPEGLDDFILLKKKNLEYLFYDEDEEIIYSLKFHVDGRCLEKREWCFSDILHWSGGSYGLVVSKKKNSFVCNGFSDTEIEMIKVKIKKLGINFKIRNWYSWNQGYKFTIEIPDNSEAAMFCMHFSKLIFTKREWKKLQDENR